MKGPNERVTLGREWSKTKPKSKCTCEHTGDGKNSQHEDGFQNGHGMCRECDCPRFTWKAFTPEYESYLNERAN